jgi:hypothetical protein
VSKSDEAKLAKLIRKNVAKVEALRGPKARKKYDPTLRADQDQDPENKAFFSEMKKREF